MKVIREKFLGCLQSIKDGISTKGVTEQSDSVVFRDGYVYSYDDEVACSIPSGLPKSITGAVKAIPFMTLLEKLPEEEIDLEFQESEIIVSGKRRRAGIRLEQEILLPISNVETPKEWLKLPDEFDEAVKLVSTCAGSDDTHFYRTCVHFHGKYLEACDNMQIARYTLDTGIKQDFLIKRDSVKPICSLGMSEFSEGEAWVHFRNEKTKLVYSCRRYLEEFPDIESALEVSGEPFTLPSGLAEVVERCQIFSSEMKDTKDGKVKVMLSLDKVKFRGDGISGWIEERPQKVKYRGPKIEFLIGGQMLADIASRHTECLVSQDRLKVDGGKYIYLSMLYKEGEETQEETPSEEQVEKQEELKKKKTKKKKEEAF